MLWLTFWRHDVLFIWWHAFHTFGHYDVIYDCMMYVLTLTLWFMTNLPYFVRPWRTIHTFWYHDVRLGVMTYVLTSWRICDIMIYFPYFLVYWHTCWCCDIFRDVMTYPLYPFFHTLWYMFLRYDLCFYVMKYFFTSRRTSWRHGVFFYVMSYVWHHDVLSIFWRFDVFFDVMT